MLNEFKKILSKIRPSINLKELKKTDDLLRGSFLDSLEMVEFINELEERYEFDYEGYEKKFDFINLENIEKFLNEKKN